VEEGGGGEGGEGARDTESKTRTPHKDVGKKKRMQPQQENHLNIAFGRTYRMDFSCLSQATEIRKHQQAHDKIKTVSATVKVKISEANVD